MEKISKEIWATKSFLIDIFRPSKVCLQGVWNGQVLVKAIWNKEINFSFRSTAWINTFTSFQAIKRVLLY